MKTTAKQRRIVIVATLAAGTIIGAAVMSRQPAGAQEEPRPRIFIRTYLINLLSRITMHPSWTKPRKLLACHS